MTDTHNTWMRRAIALAGEARDRGDEPFGSLLVADGVNVLEARNAIITTDDLTQHAELRLISKASRSLSPLTLAASILYTSTEPCAMCCGAIYWAGVGHVVFGTAGADLEAATGGGGLRRSSREVLGNASRSVLIEGPVLEEEAWTVHEGYW